MCECFARCEADCVCDHDWTPPELTAARETIAALEAERDELLATPADKREDLRCAIADISAQCAALCAERDQLRAELASWQKAFGLLTTLHGSMPIDISDPLRMAKSIEGHVRAELEASETELRIVRASQAESNAEVERLRAELAECKRLLRRYRTETVLGHQPHMIAHEVDAALAAKEE